MTEPTSKPLRLWPGMAIVTLQCLFQFVVPIFLPEAMVVGVLAGFGGGLAVVLWWLLLSRARWFERLGAVVLMIAGLFATPPFLHESIAKGAMGMLFPLLLAIPSMSAGFVLSAVATRHLSDRTRRASMVVAILLGCGVWTLVRTGGVTGNFGIELHWRWAKSPEERLMAQAGAGPAALPTAPAALPSISPRGETPVKQVEKPQTAESGRTQASIPATRSEVEAEAEWPGFRGPHRDSIIPALRIQTDWTAWPPVALWRRPIGPGWSSFAVGTDLLYTQEQRGPDEVVACYKLATGEPLWAHRDTARFWESNGGAGPRATPTLSRGRVYAFGATGILNALKADDGAVVWSRNAAYDTGMKLPGWGFASSPLVVGDVVIVAAAGRLAAYDIATGRLRWQGPDGGGSYSSPHLLTLGGVEQVLLLSDSGAVGVSPGDGGVLWKYSWPGAAIVQPALTADGGILFATGSASGGVGTRLLAIGHGPNGWTVAERWVSTGLKPYFNDLVVHNGHAFGFDGSILACIDLKDGSRKWKGGRYGYGQLVLLPDQDLLLVLSEQGELALVRATPDQFTELARFPAIEGKTWNHPVLVGDTLVVRNGQEMAAFRLSLEGR